MDQKDWKFFEVLAQEKSISKAAEKLFISQPALSYRIKKMEEEIDISLLIRTPTGILLTPAGEVFLKYVKKMRLESKSTLEFMQNMGDEVQGTISIGASSIFAYYGLPNILKSFLEKYPLVNINLTTGVSSKVYKALQENDVSIAIIHGDYYWNDMRFVLEEEPICLVYTEDVSIKDLPSITQLTYQTDAALQIEIRNWCLEKLPSPPIKTMNLDRMDTARQFALKGLGWTILPSMGLKAEDNLIIKRLWWESGELLKRKTEVLYNKESERLPAIAAFVNFIKSLYRDDQRLAIQI